MTENEWLREDNPEAMLRHFEKSPCLSPAIRHRKLRLIACALRRSGGYERLWGSGGYSEWDEDDYEIPEHHAQPEQMVYHFANRAVPANPHPDRAAHLVREIVGNPFERIVLASEYDRQYRTKEAYKDGGVHDGFRYLTLVQDAWLSPQVIDLATVAFRDRPLEKCPRCDGWGTIVDDTVISEKCPLCQGKKKVPRLALDVEILLVLADALEEAGCHALDILNHLRGLERCPVPKCWRNREHPAYNCYGCGGKSWIPLRGPHVRGCHVLDLLLKKA